MWINPIKEHYYNEFKRSKDIFEAKALQNNRPKISIHEAEKMRKLMQVKCDQETNEMFGTFVKRKLLQESPDLTSTVTADICEECGVQMMVIANDSMLACSRCAKTRVITSANAWTASMDVDFSNCNSTQKSRLLEWLEFAQAKEYGEIPDDVLKTAMQSIVSSKSSGLEQYAKIIKEERILHGPYADAISAIERLRPLIPDIEQKLKSLDSVCIRNALKSSSAKKYAERSSKIASLLSGYFPERMSADQEEYIRKLFMSASPVYEKWRKTSQPVWPGGYAYFLRCIMILLGWDEFAALFPIQMTGRNQEREDMRKDIWHTLKWEYVPSSGPQRPIQAVDCCGAPIVLDGALITLADNKCKFSSRGYDEL